MTTSSTDPPALPEGTELVDADTYTAMDPRLQRAPTAVISAVNRGVR